MPCDGCAVAFAAPIANGIAMASSDDGRDVGLAGLPGQWRHDVSALLFGHFSALFDPVAWVITPLRFSQ